MITDMVDELYHAWPFTGDPVVRARVLLAAADAALNATASEYGTPRRAAVLGIQHEIAKLGGLLNDLPTDAPAEVSTD